VTITETNETGDKSVSDPLEITMPLMNSELKITQQPKYIVYDPQSKTFVDENGSTNFSLSGTWSSPVQGNNVFNWQIGAAIDPINYRYVEGGDSGALQQENANPVNKLSYDLSSRLGKVSMRIPKSRPAVVIFGNVTGDTGDIWRQYITIPLYVKAPKVSVKTDNASLQTMLSNQTITGKGQAGDTVTIKDGSQTWTGQVQSDGSFSIQTKGLKVNDKVTITEVNGTGDKSISDPVNIRVAVLSWAISVPATVNLVVDKSYSDCLQANAKLAIVSSDGVSPFKDTSSHTFTISGKFKTAVKKVPNQKYYQYCYVNNKDSNEQVPGAFRIFAQDVNPTDWGTSGGLYTADVSKLENIQIRSSNSEIPVRFVQFKGDKVELEKANKNGYGL
ncbi:hypothetical protein PFZ79_002811, partial [Enterococcus hirae]|nr:hypothetical protein [Enterococcus hirae]